MKTAVTISISLILGIFIGIFISNYKIVLNSEAGKNQSAATANHKAGLRRLLFISATDGIVISQTRNTLSPRLTPQQGCSHYCPVIFDQNPLREPRMPK